MLKLLLAAAVACPRAVAINSKGAPSYEAKMNLFAKNNRGESCASDEGLSRKKASTGPAKFSMTTRSANAAAAIQSRL